MRLFLNFCPAVWYKWSCSEMEENGEKCNIYWLNGIWAVLSLLSSQPKSTIITRLGGILLYVADPRFGFLLCQVESSGPTLPRCSSCLQSDTTPGVETSHQSVWLQQSEEAEQFGCGTRTSFHTSGSLIFCYRAKQREEFRPDVGQSVHRFQNTSTTTGWIHT